MCPDFRASIGSLLWKACRCQGCVAPQAVMSLSTMVAFMPFVTKPLFRSGSSACRSSFQKGLFYQYVRNLIGNFTLFFADPQTGVKHLPRAIPCTQRSARGAWCQPSPSRKGREPSLPLALTASCARPARNSSAFSCTAIRVNSSANLL